MRGGLLLASLMALALVAGCVGTPGEPRGMKAGLDEARDAAAKWGEAPRLIGAFAIEPFKRLTETDDDGTLRGEFVTHLDGNPGDGRAPAWAYGFLSADGRCVFVALAGGLGVLAEGWEDCSEWMEDEPVPVMPAGLLDSTEVASILDGTEGWPEADEGSLVSWELGLEDELAYWSVVIESEDLGSYAVVDAVTGEVLEIDSIDWGEDLVLEVAPEEIPEGYESRHASDSADLVTVATPLSLEIDVDGDAALLQVVATIGTSVVGQATLRIEGPDGTLLEEPFLGTATYTFDGLPAGTYTATIEHGNVALTPALDLLASWPE